MASGRSLPPMGEPGSDSPRFCSRSTNGRLDAGQVLCGRPATHHVIWQDTLDGVENACACEEHAAEVRGRWGPIGLHPLDGNCAMPGSRWLADEDRCIADELPTEEPIRAVAREEVPV